VFTKGPGLGAKLWPRDFNISKAYFYVHEPVAKSRLFPRNLLQHRKPSFLKLEVGHRHLQLFYFLRFSC